jgi:hypothetical protein
MKDPDRSLSVRQIDSTKDESDGLSSVGMFQFLLSGWFEQILPHYYNTF